MKLIMHHLDDFMMILMLTVSLIGQTSPNAERDTLVGFLEETGQVCCAHCNCMASLGKVCTHTAAVLFYLETITRIQGKRTCTQTECEWLIPSYLNSIEYKPVKEIDLISVKS